MIVNTELPQYLVGVLGEHRRPGQVSGRLIELHRVRHQPLFIALGVPDVGDAPVRDQRLVVGDLPGVLHWRPLAP